MLTVSISVNGNVVYARSARNITDERYKKILKDESDNIYKTDAGEDITHNPKDGIVKLAKKILDTIKEV